VALKILKRSYLLLTVALIACAGAKVGQVVQSSAPAGNAPPTQIVVYPFAVDSSDVQLNSGIFQRAYRNISNEDETAQQDQLAHDTAENVCLQVVTKLSQKGFAAVCQKRGIAPGTGNILVIEGEFTDINEGNRLRRLVIGLGAGASKLDTDVYLYQPNGSGGLSQLLAFNTTADSGKMPGAGITGPAGAAAGGATAFATLGANVAMGGAKTYTSTTNFLGDKTSQQIVDTMMKYFQQQGWAPASS
jgi:Domain of unknown function (DUF4410)